MEKHIKNFFNKKITDLCNKNECIYVQITSDIDKKQSKISYNKLSLISEYLRSEIHFNKHSTSDNIIEINIPYKIDLFVYLMDNFVLEHDNIYCYSISDICNLILTLDYLQIDNDFQEYFADYLLDKIINRINNLNYNPQFIINLALQIENIETHTNNYLCKHIIITRNYDYVLTVCESIFSKNDGINNIYNKIKTMPILLFRNADKIIEELKRLYLINRCIAVNYANVSVFISQINSSFTHIINSVTDSFDNICGEYPTNILINNIEYIIDMYCQYYDFETINDIRDPILNYIEKYEIPEKITQVINKKMSSIISDDKLDTNVISYNTYMAKYIQVIYVDFIFVPENKQDYVYDFGYLFCTTQKSSSVKLKIKVNLSQKKLIIIFYDSPVSKDGSRIHFKLLEKHGQIISYKKNSYIDSTSITIVVEPDKNLNIIDSIIFNKIIY